MGQHLGALQVALERGQRGRALGGQDLDHPGLLLLVLDLVVAGDVPALAQTDQGVIRAVLAQLLERGPSVGLLRQLVGGALDRALQRLFFREQAEHHAGLPIAPPDHYQLARMGG
jgi:hypothetical protein